MGFGEVAGEQTVLAANRHRNVSERCDRSNHREGLDRGEPQQFSGFGLHAHLGAGEAFRLRCQGDFDEEPAVCSASITNTPCVVQLFHEAIEVVEVRRRGPCGGEPCGSASHSSPFISEIS